MALTRPQFVQPDHPKMGNGGNKHRSIFDIDEYLDPSSSDSSQQGQKYDLKTTFPVFYGKDRAESAKSSMFDLECYKKDHEDPGIYSLTHFDEPIPTLENAYRSGSSTPASMISAGRFAISPNSSRRSSLIPEIMTPELAKHYIPGLQTPSLEPEKAVDITEIRKILKSSFEFLADEEYNAKRSRNLSKNLSDYILYQIKILDYERYKFTCIVNVGQNLGQDIRIVSKSLWNDETDTYITESFQNKQLFVVAMVFAVYQE